MVYYVVSFYEYVYSAAGIYRYVCLILKLLSKAMYPYVFVSVAESLSVTSSPRGEVTLQVGSPLILTCEVLGLPSEVNSGLLVQWMKRGSVSSDAVGGGVEVLKFSFSSFILL